MRHTLSLDLRTPTLGLALLVGCAKAAAPEAPVDPAAWRATAPAPLATRAFQTPALARGHLSNGVPVVVVENHETPEVQVELVLRSGSATDPAGQAGLADATMSLLTEGAGKRDAIALSAELRRMASNLSAGAGLDSSSVSMDSLVRNLEPTLDLMRDVVMTPTFPKAEWALELEADKASLERALVTPSYLASRVQAWRLYGDTYAGTLSTAARLDAITTAQMKTWHKKHMVPGNAMLLVGGDITLEQVLPLLEKRFGATWKGSAPTVAPAPTLQTLAATELWAVDSPGASQSALRVATVVAGQRTSPDYFDLKLANMAQGGFFISRLNLNLREAKGYTYGAGGGVGYNRAGGVWSSSAQVRADVTAPALQEMLAEARSPAQGRPFTSAEIEAARGYLLGVFPVRFENPGEYLDWTSEQWLYGLPEDWVTGYPDHVRSVTVEATTAAWQKNIDGDHLAVVVVGDMAKLRPSLEALGLPIHWVDHDGGEVEPPTVAADAFPVPTAAAPPAAPAAPAAPNTSGGQP